jgi:hypothetical protein
MKFHEWLYEIVESLCYDRDYLYLVYIRHFNGLTAEIIERGKFLSAGTYWISGLKNDFQGRLAWSLGHRADWIGSTRVTIHYVKMVKTTSAVLEEQVMAFDFSTGQGLTPD